MKNATGHLNHGLVGILEAWSTYAMIVTGLAAMFLMQNALQAGRLIACAPTSQSWSISRSTAGRARIAAGSRRSARTATAARLPRRIARLCATATGSMSA